MINITNSLIAINIIIFALQQLYPISVVFGMNHLFFTSSLWFQPLTSIFLHGSIMHLGMNMAVLFQFGTLLERHLGGAIFASAYVLGGILTSIISGYYLFYIQENANMIGASGAISLLVGIYGYLNPSYLKGFFLFIGIISFAPMLLGINVAWYAHFIGFLLGILIGYLYIKVKKYEL